MFVYELSGSGFEFSCSHLTIHLFEKSAIEFKSTVCSKFYQQSSENYFQTNWRQNYNINYFNNVIDCYQIFVHNDTGII